MRHRVLLCSVRSGSTLFALACLSKYLSMVIWSNRTPLRNHPGSDLAFWGGGEGGGGGGGGGEGGGGGGPNIMKTRLCNSDPLKPHFYTVKLGFTGVYIIFLISAQNIDCGYSLEPPRWGNSNEYPQSMFWAEIWKKYQNFYLTLSFFW